MILSFPAISTYLQGKHWAAAREERSPQFERERQWVQVHKSLWSHSSLLAVQTPEHQNPLWMTAAPLKRYSGTGPAAAGSRVSGP